MDATRSKILTIVLFCVLLFQCKPPELSNACDGKSKGYALGSLIRFVTGDRSPSCLPSFDFQDLWGVFQAPSGDVGVNAMASYRDQIIIGGNFQLMGPSTGSAAYLQTSNGKVVPSRYCRYLKIVGTTSIAIPDGGGGFYIGGEFYSVQGENRYSVAHILPGCQVDRVFKVPRDIADARVIYSLALNGDHLYVGGNFTSWGDTSQKYLIRLNRYTGDIDTSFSVQNIDNSVFDLETQFNSLFVCGEFSQIAGIAKRGIAKVSLTNGTLDTSFNTVITTGTCLDLSLGTDSQGSPNLFIVGDLIAPSRNYALSVTPDGTLTNWNPNPNAQVNSVQQYQNKIFLGGAFTTINGGTVSSYLAAVNQDTGILVTNNYALNAYVASLQVIENNLYMSGQFTIVKGIPRISMASLDLTDESVTLFNPNFEGVISNPGSSFLQAGNGVVFVTFDRSTVNVVPRNHFAVIDEYTGVPIEGTPNFDFPIKSMNVNGNRLFVGGTFTNIGGQSRTSFAILDLPHYQVSSTNVVLSGSPEIRTITSDESKVYAGGISLGTVNGQTRNGVFALNLSDLSLSNWNPDLGVGSSGESILVVNDLVFIGGSFTQINGVGGYQNLQAVDKLNGLRMDIPSSSTLPGGLVYSLAYANSKIYIGGFFSNITGVGSVGNAAVYDLGSRTFLQPNPVTAENMVNYVATYPDGNVFYGGSFANINGDTKYNTFGVYQSYTNSMSTWNADFTNVVYTSMFKNGKYYLGGIFTVALRELNGGIVRSSLYE
ncbi:hypothetical protein EHQ96_12895 [Leptospira levettii]|uniref:hypothetical protein n=1 Tax=Leptospira levettii TaxID=2023178 RepID=UPI00108285B9|nr:hypothetical protein [Leptospira levettii]TGM38820.1 hypothetical protein EHQ75_11735 [Leptospira levettii]TGM66349.1 hypothetical protein EHQ96_12895 [Leptospira levettii]